MASKQHELTVSLSANLDSSYTKAFENAQQTAASYNAQMKTLQQQLSDIQSWTKQQAQVEATTKKLALLREQYANTEAAAEKAGDESGEWSKQLAKLQGQINNTERSLSTQEGKLQATSARLEAAGVDTSNLTSETTRLNAEYDTAASRAETANKHYEEMKSKLEDVASATASATDVSTEYNSIVDEIATGAARALGEQLVSLAEQGLQTVIDQFKAAVSAAIEFESAITGVAKTTDLSDEELQDYSDAIKDLAEEIPVTTTELAAVSETAGQLGIAKEDLLDFTETMANLATATTMTADEGATMLAQFANITQMDASKYSNLASAVVDLGNNYATTEEKILDMAQSVAASGSLAGMSESDIVGLTAAVSSLGIESQAGGTALSTLISDMMTAVETGEDLDEWARVANMTAEEFTELWGESATDALIAFIEGLNDTERLGSSATVTLQNLGITETRLTRTVLSLANSGDLLTSAIEDANAAFEENTALSAEAEKRYATTESQITLLQNSLNNLLVTVGEKFTPAVSTMAGNLADFISGVDDALADAQTSAEAYSDAIETVANTTAYLAAYEEYEQLKKSVELTEHYGGTAEDLADQEARLAETKEKLISLSDGLITATADETEEFEAQAEVVAKLNEGQQASALSETREYLLENAADYTEVLENQARAEADLEEAESQRVALLDDWQEKQNNSNEALAAYNTLVTEVGNGLLDTAEGVQKYEEELDNLETLYEDLTGQSLDFTNLAEAQVYFDELQDTVDAAEQAYRDNEDYINNQIPTYLAQEEARAETYIDQLLSYIENGGATAEAAAEMFGVPIENITAAVAELVYTSGADIEEAASTYGLSVGDLESAVEELEAAAEDAEDAVGDASDEMDDTSDATVSLADDTERLTEMSEAMAAGVLDGSFSLESAREYMAQFGDTTMESRNILHSFDDAMTDALEDLWDMDAAEYAEDQITSVTDAIDDLIQSYNEAKESVSSNIGLFDNMTPDDEDTTTAAELLQSLQSQQTYMEQYQANLEKVQAMGLNSDLLSNLLDGSEDSANTLAAIASASQETVDELNAQWEETQEMKDTWSTTLTDMQEDWDTELGEILDDIPEIVDELNQSTEAAAAGKETMLAYAESLSSNLSSVEAAAKAAAQAAANAFSVNFTVSGYAVSTSASTASTGSTSSGSGSGSSTKSSLTTRVAAYASGGILNRPHIAWVAEDGPEAIIPLTDRERGLELWTQTGAILGGLYAHADGGVFGSVSGGYTSGASMGAVYGDTVSNSYGGETFAPSITINVQGGMDIQAAQTTARTVERQMESWWNKKQRDAKRMAFR